LPKGPIGRPALANAKSPYESWSQNYDVARDLDLKNSELAKEMPLKQSIEVRKNMDQIRNYSPDFTLKKLNNYDNTIKFM